jgi:hypothetical protein
MALLPLGDGRRKKSHLPKRRGFIFFYIFVSYFTRTLHEVQKTVVSHCYVPSSEPCTIQVSSSPSRTGSVSLRSNSLMFVHLSLHQSSSAQHFLVSDPYHQILTKILCYFLLHTSPAPTTVALRSVLLPNYSGAAFSSSPQLEWRCIQFCSPTTVALRLVLLLNYSGAAFSSAPQLQWRCVQFCSPTTVALRSVLLPNYSGAAFSSAPQLQWRCFQF